MKKTTFVSIDHASPRAVAQLGGDLDIDLSPVVAAIKEVGQKIEALSLKMPGPHVVECTPVVNISPTEAPAVNVSLPEMSPRIEVNPADVIFQKSDGTFAQQVVEVQMPWGPLVLMGAIPAIVMIIDLIMRMS